MGTAVAGGTGTGAESGLHKYYTLPRTRTRSSDIEVRVDEVRPGQKVFRSSLNPNAPLQCLVTGTGANACAGASAEAEVVLGGVWRGRPGSSCHCLTFVTMAPTTSASADARTHSAENRRVRFLLMDILT